MSTIAPWAFGLDEALAEHLGDDAVERALDRLFDADRAALLTVVVAAVDAFGLITRMPAMTPGSWCVCDSLVDLPLRGEPEPEQ